MMPLRASVHSAPVLAALHAASFAKAWSEEEFRILLQQPGVAAWISGDPPYGFILVRAVEDEAEILTLAVVPAYRRRGVASALVRTACSELAQGGVGRVFLEVASDNAAARALYIAQGFAPCGQRPAYYERAGKVPVDAVVMQRALQT